MQNNYGLYCLAPLVIRDTYHCDIFDCLMGANSTFHLRRINIFPTGYDHVCLPVYQGVKAIFIPSGHISGRRPFPKKCLFGLFRLFQVLLEEHGGPVKNFSYLTIRHRVSVLIEQLDSICAKDFFTYRAKFFKLIFRPQERYKTPLCCPIGFPKLGILEILHDG